MAIYTKRGDKGETSLYDAMSTQRIRVSKNSTKIHVLGSVDELNSFLGIIVSMSDDKKLGSILKEIQKNLFTIGSIMAGSNLRFYNSSTKKMEKIIDDLETSLPALQNFILPGGNSIAAHLHMARSIARRMERSLIELYETESVRPQILTYVNRLSDFLFMLARQVNFEKGTQEDVWIGRKG